MKNWAGREKYVGTQMQAISQWDTENDVLQNCPIEEGKVCFFLIKNTVIINLKDLLCAIWSTEGAQ